MSEEYDHIESKCRWCSADSAFDHLLVEEHDAPDECPEEYTLAKCRACNQLSLFYRDDVELKWEAIGEIPSYSYLWPSEPRFLEFSLPELIGDSYTEAVNAEKAGLTLASSVMIGRTLEAVCKDFDSTVKSIYGGLKVMLDQGALSQEMYEWANELRILRNEGAHAEKHSFSAEDVSNALDFLQSILELIYDIRPKFKAFQESRKTANKSQNGSAPTGLDAA